MGIMRTGLDAQTYLQQALAKKLSKQQSQAGTSALSGKQTAAQADSTVVELSTAGQSMQAGSTAQAGQTGTTEQTGAAAQAGKAEQTGVHFFGEGASRKLRFKSAGAVQQALKDGFVTLNGQQYFLTDDQMKTLTARDKTMQKLRQGVSQANALAQQAVAAQRQGESMQKSAQAQSRIFETAMRIMKGRKVSQADEKELAEAAPDLYKIAKSMAALEQHKLTRKEEEEDNKISEQHDEDREWEQAPSSIPDATETPVPEYSVDIEMPDSGVDIEA